MTCTLCKSKGKKNSFTTPGCPFMTKDNCVKHAKTQDHKNAVTSQLYAPMFEKSVANVYKREESAVKSAMTNIYYMAKKNQPNSDISDLNWLCIMQGNDSLKHLQVDSHTTYEHSTSVHDFQDALKITLDEEIMKEITESEYFAILIDEMCDVSMEKTLVIYLRYMVARQVCCRFIEVVGLEEGDAETI